MPASTCKQYRKAGAAAGRGEPWGKEMVKKTSPEMRARCAKGGEGKSEAKTHKMPGGKRMKGAKHPKPAKKG